MKQTREPGLEPELSESKSDLLPLQHSPICAVPMEKVIKYPPHYAPTVVKQATLLGIIILCEAFCLLSHHLGATQPTATGGT